MNERILNALVTLFAIIAEVDDEGKADRIRGIVRAYLKQHLNTELTEQYLLVFDKGLERHHRSRAPGTRKARKQISVNSVRLLKIAQELNGELIRREKIIVILRMFDFFNDENEMNQETLVFLDTLADVFNIEKQEYVLIQAICLLRKDILYQSPDTLIISAQNFEEYPQLKHIDAPNLTGDIFVVNLQSINTYVFCYTGTDNLYLNHHQLKTEHVYQLESGASIRGPKMRTLYFSDINGKFILARHKHRIVYSAHEIEFKFEGSEAGIQRFSFMEESGQMVGIMGGSGVGKSTLLNILNGNLPLLGGSIQINGFDLHHNKSELKGVIGFVPQDDLLIEELTVFQNLYFNARLCFKNLRQKQIIRVVAKIMVDLDLISIKHLRVGNPLNKFISGGQRKRLNIALELMRQPSVLIVDEPTSGLSSMDSDMVINLLKEQSVKGKLIFVNIHQPSSEIYKMFDKMIVIDKGGFPIYFGNPVDAIIYFKKANQIANADESQCTRCGNVNPEQILEIVESRVVNEHGMLSRTRKRSPNEWYEMYRQHSSGVPQTNKELELPANDFKVPSKWRQFLIFLSRNVLAKLTNRQYLLINLLEAPLLAVILGYFTKYIAGTPDDPDAYIFSLNDNLAAYLFMSVIVALFLGMTLSAEEIIRDKRLLMRESFLNLSKFAYLNSKVVVMFLMSAIQMLSFVLIGNLILDIRGLTFDYWLLLFSTAALANLIGLNISAALNSVVNIYILIPFILVPQLLLSGVIVGYDKLHKSVNSYQYTPIVGDMMVSRWAYEALAVNQFRDNAYNHKLFWTDQHRSFCEYQYVFLIPELETRLNQALQERNKQKLQKILDVVHNEIQKIPNQTEGVPIYSAINRLNVKRFTPTVAESCFDYLRKLKKMYRREYETQNQLKDSIFSQLETDYGNKENIIALKDKYNNEKLTQILTNEMNVNKLKEIDGNIIQLRDPIYNIPTHRFGRAHYYAPVKRLGNSLIHTYWFNFGVLWFISAILYTILHADTLKKMIEYKLKPIQRKKQKL